MTKILFLLIALITLALLPAQETSTAISDFSFRLLQQLETEENLVFSPYSIYTALAMTSEGAAGDTQKQMAAILQNPQSTDLAKLQLSLSQNTGKYLQWQVANSLWLEQDFKVEKKFLKILQREYLAEIQRADFIRQPQQSLQMINNWVSDNTQGKIPAILNELDPLTRLVLINAVYFLGDWEYPFRAEVSHDDDFHTSQTTVSVPFMQQTHTFYYYDDAFLQAVMLPYKDSDFAMLLILPREKGISELLNGFDVNFFDRIRNSQENQRVDLSLPRFQLDYKRELSADLSILGMPLAFAPQADFSRISKKHSLMIDKVMHRAFIVVNEKGTEAAAATAVSINLTSAGPPKTPIIFKADHPFLFLLLEKQTGTILFTGCVNDPR
ncbi:MAG: serpin family protein [Candidatus Cloacimonetes bacterium]|nr:serpin family protein [Candidatus Cloacimonadota bacterium]